MLVVVIILSCTTALFGWLAYANIRKSAKMVTIMELYLRILGTTAVHVRRAYKRMQEVDRLGSFQADDETGFIFQEIKDASTELHQFIERYLEVKDDKDAEKKN